MPTLARNYTASEILDIISENPSLISAILLNKEVVKYNGDWKYDPNLQIMKTTPKTLGDLRPLLVMKSSFKKDDTYTIMLCANYNEQYNKNIEGCDAILIDIQSGKILLRIEWKTAAITKKRMSVQELLNGNILSNEMTVQNLQLENNYDCMIAIQICDDGGVIFPPLYKKKHIANQAYSKDYLSKNPRIANQYYGKIISTPHHNPPGTDTSLQGAINLKRLFHYVQANGLSIRKLDFNNSLDIRSFFNVCNQ